MKNRTLLFLAVLFLVSATGAVFAQDRDERRADRGSMVVGSGEPETFKTNALFLATTQFHSIVLDLTCLPPNVKPGDLGPGDVCLLLNPAPARTDFNVRDIAHVTLPRNSTKNIILATTNHSFFEEFNNTTAGQAQGLFHSRPYLTIESDALRDPRAIDPSTGQPANGKLDSVGLLASRRLFRKLDTGEVFDETLSFSSTLGFSKSTFTDPNNGFGLPADIVDRMFDGEITIRLNVKGSARIVDSAIITVGLRLMGNPKSED